jgi:tRNA-splicing ligase RtcB
MDKTFGSTCHGAGRAMSRHAAIKEFRGEDIKKELESKGEVIRGASWEGLAEEAPKAYKDVDQVIESVHGAGISMKAVKLTPLGVIKG